MIKADYRVLAGHRDRLNRLRCENICITAETECVLMTSDLLCFQIARLRSELDVVRGNTKVMSEMLTEMVPGQENASDLELLQVRGA